jgi:hypothetical protein
MTLKFIIPAIVMGFTCLVLAYLSFKFQKNLDTIQTVVNVTVFTLWAIEWFYLAGYFMLNPGTFPSTDREREVMAWTVMPLITQIPLLGLFLFSIIYNRIKKKK